MKYTLNDIFIVPAKVSLVESRSECDPYCKDGMLPLFTAPMSSVIDLNNYKLFLDNKINPIIPRNIPLKDRIDLCDKVWCAFGLDEFIKFTNDTDPVTLKKSYILIDIANGHMMKLHDIISMAKEKFGEKITIMAGNIANPETYKTLSEAGADFIRLGIGTGCFTGNMKVLTDNGRINIKDIKIGDKVLTHSGDYEIVENVISYEEDDEILEINGIECTKKHEFYVIDKELKELVTDDNYKDYAKWVKADELDKDKHLLIKL